MPEISRKSVLKVYIDYVIHVLKISSKILRLVLRLYHSHQLPHKSNLKAVTDQVSFYRRESSYGTLILLHMLTSSPIVTCSPLSDTKPLFIERGNCNHVLTQTCTLILIILLNCPSQKQWKKVVILLRERDNLHTPLMYGTQVPLIMSCNHS